MVGATGIVGQAVARRLVEDGCEDLRPLPQRYDGPPRRPSRCRPTWATPKDSRAAATPGKGRLVAITAWTRMGTEAENIRVNGGAGVGAHLLAALSPGGEVRHVALMTGLKHYLGPFEAYGEGEVPDTPFREEEERLPYPTSTTRRRTAPRRRGARRVHLERAPLPHGVRARHGRCHEHGGHPLRLRRALP